MTVTWHNMFLLIKNLLDVSRDQFVTDKQRISYTISSIYQLK